MHTHPLSGKALATVLLAASSWLVTDLRGADTTTAIAQGPFKPDPESLRQYACPEWFRDAKFGIWAHWGPQSVPMAGDWYARNMYLQGQRQYQHHLANYGHPSTNGWKDIIPLWRAEKWEPDRLMALYKRAGARYFVSMGVHHDNFDLWNSTYHKWNAVNTGPKRDIVGDWQKAAKKQGLYFGVSEHLGASFTWWQGSHKSDGTGPLAGVAYDGADARWADLYHPPAAADDKGWYSNNPEWHREWFARIKDLVDHYKPDLLYTDGGVPFGNETGLGLVAHYYNADAARRGSHPHVVYTCKQRSEGRWIEDLERGVMAKVNPDPWQTDTSIGDWFYNKDWKFRPVNWVVQMLVDIVSKNGNLLLNVVQRPDGTIDPEVERMLEQMAAWIKVNGEAIYDTRPWTIYGEGPVRAKGGHFGEDFAYSHQDIRFTTKGKTLYAFALGWPADGQLKIRSLAKMPGTSANRISSISLLGHRGKLSWEQTEAGLAVTLPAGKPCEYAVALEIHGRDLTPVSFVQPAPVIRPGQNGTLRLEADAAQLHGDQIKTETRGNITNVGFWDRADEWASWDHVAFAAGTYEVVALVGTVHPDSRFSIEVAGQKLIGTAPNTGAWERFETVNLGKFTLAQAGELPVVCRPTDAATWKAINLVRIEIKPVK